MVSVTPFKVGRACTIILMTDIWLELTRLFEPKSAFEEPKEGRQSLGLFELANRTFN